MSSENTDSFIKRKKFFIAFFTIAGLLFIWNFTYGPTTPDWQYHEMIAYAHSVGFVCETEQGVPANYFSGVITFIDPLPPSMTFWNMLDQNQLDEIQEIIHERIKLLPCYESHLIEFGE